jgi:hypothetical protein
MRATTSKQVRSHVSQPGMPGSSQAPPVPSAENTVMPGSSEATAAATASRAASSDSRGTPGGLGLLQEAVYRLRTCDAPVRKIYFGEVHDAPENLNLIGQVLEGAVAARAGKIRLYKELNFPAGHQGERDFDERGENPRFKNQAGKLILDTHVRPGVVVDEQDARRFVNAARDQDVSFRMMNWHNPERRDMTRFVQDRQFAIAWTGATHALSRLHPSPQVRDIFTDPWLGEFSHANDTQTSRNLAMLPPVLRERALTRGAQEDMLDGAARSQEAAPTVLVLSSSIWACPDTGPGDAAPEGRVLAPQEKRARFIRYYNSQGFAVIEVPFADRQHATMVVPGQYLPQLRELAAAHPDEIRLFCNGLPGGPPVPAPDLL